MNQPGKHWEKRITEGNWPSGYDNTMVTVIRHILQSIALLPSLMAGGFGLLAILLVLLPPVGAQHRIENVLAITDQNSIENIFGFIFLPPHSRYAARSLFERDVGV